MKPVGASETRWTYRSRQIRAIRSSLESYCQTFEKILQRREPSFLKCAAEARGFLDRLESFEFNFWVDLFDQLFTHTDILYRKLQRQNLSIGWAGPAVDECKSSLENTREELDTIYDTVAESYDPPTANKRKRKRNTLYDCYVGVSGGETILSHKDNMRRLGKEVIDKMLRCLGDRFSGITQFKFFSLLDTTKYPSYREEFPKDAWDQLVQSPYAKAFDLPALKRQLQAIFKRDHLPKHLDVLVRQNHELGLHTVTSTAQFARLAELALTIPLTVSSAERSFSTLKRIKDRLRSTMSEGRLSDLSILSVEKKLAKQLNRDTIIDRFAGSKQRRIKLLYKD